jgi:hypothetical protein
VARLHGRRGRADAASQGDLSTDQAATDRDLAPRPEERRAKKRVIIGLLWRVSKDEARASREPGASWFETPVSALRATPGSSP